MTRKLRPLPLALFIVLPALAFSSDRAALPEPADLPAWAETGAFRFIRIDGGDIETMKAQRTWWGKKFSADEYDVLAHAYDTHFEKILGLLKQARFNWIWVTWSNGWSLETEGQNRAQLARVIERCHAEGIRVTAYVSASNMFWRDAWKEDPKLSLYGLWYGPVPIFYAGNPEGRVEVNFSRRMADARFSGWRQYLLKKVGLAIDAGVDAVFYDNLIGDTGAFAKLLDETRALAREKAAISGRPPALVYSNVHLAPGRFNLCDRGEVVWMEDGKDSPGLWDGVWQVEGARKIKFLRGEMQPWQPLKYENDVYHCGHRERCIPGPEVQKLSMAEAHAFGAAYSRNIEGRFLTGLVRDEPEAVAAWEAIAQYNQFLEEHKDFYRGVKSVATLALICRRQDDPLADAFIRQSVQFETKVWGHLEDGAPLKDLRVAVVNELPTRLRREDVAILRDFVAGGGKILAADPVRLSALTGIRVGAGIELFTALNGDRHRLSVEGGNGAVIARAARSADGRLIIHLLNYDYSQTAEGVKVTVESAGSSVEAFSPDGPVSLSGIQNTEGKLTFTVDRLSRYAVVAIRKSR